MDINMLKLLKRHPLTCDDISDIVTKVRHNLDEFDKETEQITPISLDNMIVYGRVFE